MSEETEAAAARARQNAITAGKTSLQAAIDAAQADATKAAGLRTSALAVASALVDQKVVVDAWNPSATYKSSDLKAIQGQLSNVISRLTECATALAELYQARVDSDQDAILTHTVELWIAREITGE